MVYMFFAPGFEEVEAIATLDVIRRSGIEAQSVGVGSLQVTGAHGITIICDKTDSEIFTGENLAGIVLPGGMPGTENLMKSEAVNEFIDFCDENNRFICAICAAPMILGRKGLLKGRKAVCFPGFEDELKGAEVSDKFVCRDGTIITAKGMGSSIDFALEIVAAFTDKATADRLRGTLQCP